MKRILFVCSGLSIGGAERVVSLLSDSLFKNGNKVYILAFLKTENSYPMNPDVKVIFAPKRNRGAKGKIDKILSIRRVIKEYKVDVVISFSHYNTMSAIIAGIGCNVKQIGSERNDPAQLKERKMFDRLRSRLYKHLDYLVCQTNDAKEYFDEEIQKRSVVIMNPISANLPDRYEGKREKRIVSFSRFEPQKNIPMLVDAFTKLHGDYPEYSLEIYGDGSEKENIIHYIHSKEMSKFITVFPFVNNIHEQVKRATMFAMASDYEGLSNSMIEAMAIGLPTVVTDCPCGGARMMIKDGYNGYLVPVGDTVALYEKMKHVIEHPEDAAKVAIEGTRIRQTLDKEKIAAQWIGLI